MKKSGLTMISIVIYVVLFFMFTVFAAAMSTNMNYNTITEKGKLWANKEISKLEYNLFKSAKESKEIAVIQNRITFSNNDEYEYDATNHKILKNGSPLVSDVESFSIIKVRDLTHASTYFINNVDEKVDNVCVEFTIKKYNQERRTQFVVSAGVNIVE